MEGGSVAAGKNRKIDDLHGVAGLAGRIVGGRTSKPEDQASTESIELSCTGWVPR